MPVEIAAVVIRSDPKAKTRARMGKGGHWYTPNDVVAAEAQIGWAIRAVLRGRLVDALSVFAVDAKFHLKGAPRRDVDNLLKLVLDACTNIETHDAIEVVEVGSDDGESLLAKQRAHLNTLRERQAQQREEDSLFNAPAVEYLDVEPGIDGLADPDEEWEVPARDSATD